MKVKKEYMILSVVIVALGLYLFFRSTDRTTYRLPELPTLKAQDLSKIEIGKGDQTVTLDRSDDGWQVSPGDYPADTRLVQRVLDDLAALSVTALVSETQNYARYELDEKNQIRVKAYRDGNVVRDFHIGKAADTMRHTHITLAGDANVYHAQGNFRNDFDQSVESLRDKTVLAFKPAEVVEFVIATPERSVTVRKTPAPQPAAETDTPSETGKEGTSEAENTWQIMDGPAVETETVERLLEDLSGLKCRAYLTDRSKADLANPIYQVRIQTGETALLEIFVPADEAATEMPARSSLRPDPFTLADFDIDPVKDFMADLAGDEENAETGPEGQTSP